MREFGLSGKLSGTAKPIAWRITWVQQATATYAVLVIHTQTASYNYSGN